MTRDAPETVDVVTCFLRSDARVLLLRRSEAVGSYSGRWGAVAGHAEGDPDAAARAEIGEETGLDPEADVTLVRAGDPFVVDDADRGHRWRVHPSLFDAATREVEPNYETVAFEWVHPTEIRRRETVPDLWTSYDRVRPDVETIAADRDHGAAWLSLRALEHLRDEAALAGDDAAGGDGREDDGGEAGTDDSGVDGGEAGTDDSGVDGGEGGGWHGLASVARRLRDARPAMPVVGNRINRAMAAASDDRTPAAVEAAARDGIERALTADGDAAAVAADHVGARVGTLSRSGTVLATLERAAPDSVLVAESRPGREGAVAAEAVAARTGAAVTVTTDAAFGGELAADAETLLVGADAVLADGRVVNKVGTRSATAVARREGIDCYAVAASDKVSPDEAFDPEARDPGECYRGDADVAVANPTFEATPADCFDAVLTERGPLDAAAVRDLAASHRERAAWADDA